MNGNLCFEYIEGPQTAPLHLPPHSCLPVRAMLNQSHNFCQASHECLSQDTHCMKPSLDNVTKVCRNRKCNLFSIVNKLLKSLSLKQFKITDYTNKEEGRQRRVILWSSSRYL